jgi:hypothetical protein
MSSRPFGSEIGGLGAWKPTLRRVAVLLLPFGLVTGLAGAQEPTSRIVGTVTDSATGLPLAGVQATLLGTAQTATTSSQGRFEFLGLAAGRYVVHVRTVGYGGATLEADLAAGAVEEFTVALTAVSVVLPEVVVEGEAQPIRVSPSLQGFYQRAAGGFGYFLKREDIERINPTETSELLRTVPGIEVTRQGGNWESSIRSAETPLTMADGQATECPVQVYVNGHMVPTALDAFNFNPGAIDLVRPQDIEGIEVYRRRTEIPHQFMRSGSFGQPPCAVILIWTREVSFSP